ncbi:hypothetical protein QBC46DRAFT_459253 [Diplogelasinospora grovesii]|uniref:N-acetylglucosamine-induced protein 1 n=1 Tax=Diplogelasinospora grovesii TaxID=303347 RepID=A0AAN6N6G6_9PEZI|nr:hypothetical protein QBC46DRAFT_459253 [Diplogelasinospora grovesii]
MGYGVTDIPYWHVNVPLSQRTAECPDFLLNLSEKDLNIIRTPDSAYHFDTWDDVCAKVAENTLELFQRKPSDLRRYLAWSADIGKEYGSMMNFILTTRLAQWEWTENDGIIRPKGRPFECEDDDIKILQNDWPYGIDERIVHLVVWTKFELADDPATGDLTDQARAEIDAYVQRKFAHKMDKDHVIWFKNWQSIKSVKAVEHFHVMLFDPDPKFVEEITNGDVPLFERMAK